MIAKTLTLTALLLTGQAFAQSTLETNLDWDSKALDYIKSHFSASYHGEMYGVRRDALSEDKNESKIKDYRVMHNPTLIYNPSPNWAFLSTAEFKYSDQPSQNATAAFPNGFYRSLFTLTRKNILTEKENGIKLDLGVGRRQFNTGAEQGSTGHYKLGSYGNNRAFANLSKNIGNLSSSLFVQYLHNDIKYTNAGTWKHGLELIPTLNFQITDRLSYLFNDDFIINTSKFDSNGKSANISHEMNIGFVSYQWSDKVSTYYQLKYLHIEDFSGEFQTQDDWFENYIGLTYSFTPKNSVTFEIGSELAHARDGRDGFSEKAAYPELALYVDLAI